MRMEAQQTSLVRQAFAMRMRTSLWTRKETILHIVQNIPMCFPLIFPEKTVTIWKNGKKSRFLRMEEFRFIT